MPEAQDALRPANPQATSSAREAPRSFEDPNRKRDASIVRGEGETRPLSSEVDVVAAHGERELVAYDAQSSRVCIAPLGELAVSKSCRPSSAVSFQVMGAGPETARDSQGIKVTVAPAQAWGFAPAATEYLRFTRDDGSVEEFGVFKSRSRRTSFFLVPYDMTAPGAILVQAVSSDGTVLAEERSRR